MKKNFLFFIIQFCITCYCQEKQATLIFMDNTTMEGFGEIKRNKIYFRISEDDEKTEWDSEMAKGIIFSSYGFYEKYEFQKPEKNSKPIIMEVLEEGNVNLYRKSKIVSDYNQMNGVTNAVKGFENMSVLESKGIDHTYYVKRNNEEYSTDITFSFYKRAKRYFSDCPDIIEGIEDKSYNWESIHDMVIYYNKYCNVKK